MMKNLAILLVTIALFSCKEEIKPTYVVFEGNVENNSAETAMIFGNDFEIKIPISDTGTFSDTLDIDIDGFYTLRIGRESTSIYLIKNSNFAVKLDAKEFDETLLYSGDVASENNYLAAKYLLSEKEMSFSDVFKMSESDFLKEISVYKDNYIKLLNESLYLSETFIELESKELEYAHIMNLENYPGYYIYLTSDKSFKVSESFYGSIKDINFKDTIAFRNSHGYQKMLLTHYGRLSDENSGLEKYNKTVSFLKNVDFNLPNGYAKDNLMSKFLTYNLKADESLEEAYNLYINANPNSENLPKITENYNLLKNLTLGNKSPTFDYENHKGGTTSLNDLKGKYVYVDVWATWCGPCKREIPYLKEVEMEYHDKNIAFVSISIDVKKDHDTWIKMVDDKDLAGVQLFADNDWKSKFVTDYGIKGIPRFILIDDEGNIVNSDAPRPSNSDLRDVLESLDF